MKNSFHLPVIDVVEDAQFRFDVDVVIEEEYDIDDFCFTFVLDVFFFVVFVLVDRLGFVTVSVTLLPCLDDAYKAVLIGKRLQILL